MVPPAAKAGADAAQKQSAAAKPGQVEAAKKAELSKFAKGRQGADGGAQQAAARDSSKTVFVRALPADASQDQLHLAFSKFGKLRSCRLVASFAILSPLFQAHVCIVVQILPLADEDKQKGNVELGDRCASSAQLRSN